MGVVASSSILYKRRAFLSKQIVFKSLFALDVRIFFHVFSMFSSGPMYLIQPCVVLCLIGFVVGGADQRRLLKRLLIEQQYDPLERPVQNDSKTLPVSINLAVQQIVDFDGKNQIIIISGWMVLTWHDYTLTWKPEDFGNIQTIRIPSAQIWTPDIILYNSADDKFDSTIKVNAVVQHTGEILYVPPGMFRSICRFNIASFPFDTQSCTLKFGSWTHDDAGINLTAESSTGQLDAYTNNSQWDLEEFSATNNALKYDCCPTLYPFVLFTIRIRRRSLYYLTNVVIPCFLISCMTILGFLLAPDSGEKLTLQITTLLSVVTFSLLISDIMPPSSTAVPVITIYFLCVMCMCAVSVTASVFVISLHFRDAKNYTMPLWIQKYISHYLAWLLRMKRPGHDLTWYSIRHRWSSVVDQTKNVGNHIDLHHSNGFPASLSNSHTNTKKQHFQLDGVSKIAVSSVPALSHTQGDPSPSIVSHAYETGIICSELNTIISQLHVVTDYIRREEKYDNESQEWRFVAMVIDRLCLLVFMFFITTVTVLVFLSASNFYHAW